jgi:hypothetical protein
MNIPQGPTIAPRKTFSDARRMPPAKRSLSFPVMLLTTALCAVSVQARAADPVTVQKAGAHPITGKWAWTVAGTSCNETLQYRTDGTRVGASGEEMTEAQFQITAKPSLLGFYRLTETLTVANGKRDCAGDLHVAGQEGTIRFIQFSPKNDQLIVCKTESLQACYGPLRRSPE